MYISDQYKSFQHQSEAKVKGMASLKAEDMLRKLGGKPGERLNKFHEHNLDELQVPVEARPISGQPYAGKHGYTLRGHNGSVLWKLIWCNSLLFDAHPISL